MRARTQKLLRIAGYCGFSVAALLLSLYATFPGEAVGVRFAQELSNATGGKVSATIGNVGLYRLTGLIADDVRLKVRIADPPVPITLDSVRVRLQILPLFLFDLDIYVEVDAGEAVLSAMLAPRGKEALEIAAEVEKLDVASPPLLPAVAGIPISGVLSGKLSGELDRDVRRANGDLTMTLTGVGIGPGEPVKGFSLPSRVGFGQLDLALTLENGRLRIAQFSQRPVPAAPDLQIRSVTGSASLRPSLRSSSYDACVELKLADGFLARNQKFKAVVDLATIPPPMGPGLKKAPDGFLHASLSGSFATRPRSKGTLCRPSDAAQHHAGRSKPNRPGRTSRTPPRVPAPIRPHSPAAPSARPPPPGTTPSPTPRAPPRAIPPVEADPVDR